MKSQLQQAIEHAGGAAAVAALFSIKPVSVYEWISRGYVPAERCPQIERHTKGAVRCEQLNANVDWAYIRGTAI